MLGNPLEIQQGPFLCSGVLGVITMDMVGRIRRLHSRGKKSAREIARITGLSRNTVAKWLQAPVEAPPKYQRRVGTTKLEPYHEMLKLALKADARRPAKGRRTVSGKQPALLLTSACCASRSCRRSRRCIPPGSRHPARGTSRHRSGLRAGHALSTGRTRTRASRVRCAARSVDR